jgi:DNA-binding transcriptional ArsR family regulator
MVTNVGSAVFHAVADPIRRRILDRLRRSPAETGRIAADFPVSRPAISKHLRILEEAGLVRGKRAGRRRVYTLAAAPLRRVEEWLAPYREQWASDPDLARSGEAREKARSAPRARRSPGKTSAR